MKIEHGVIIALLLILIFLQAKSGYGSQDPTSIPGASGGFYDRKAPTA
jgi:hypothetical protein